MEKQRRNLLLTTAKIGLLCGLVALSYWPARHGGYILDDDLLLTENQMIKAPTGWYRFWTTEAVDFWPLTNDTFWIQWRLWGKNPTGYHVTNVLLHIASSLLIWQILCRLQIPGAYFASLLFAVHPVNVESVAWIAQLKNTLSLLFFLLSILWYLKADDRFNRWYALSLFAFVLAGLSKGSVLILPLVLLLIAWWRRGRIVKKDVLWVAPFFVVAAVLSGINVWFQTHGMGEAIRDVTFLQRLTGAGAVVWFYLSKALAPIHLSFVYPPWNIHTSDVCWWLPLMAAIIVTALLVWKNASSQAQWIRVALLAWGFYCIALLPVMGFTDVGFMKYSLVADHYQQIALIAVVAGVAAIGTSLANRWHEHGNSVKWLASLAASATVVGLLTFQTWRQSELYESPIRLYEATLADYPDCWMAHNNLGLALANAHRVQDALAHYRRSLEIKFDDPACLVNLGASLAKLGKKEQASEYYRQALKFEPDYLPAITNLGVLFAGQKQSDRALDQYQQALRINPDYVPALNDLGTVLAGLGRTDQAIAKYQRALELDPNCAEAHFNWASALFNSGRKQDSIEHYETALAFDPEYVEAHQKLAEFLAEEGQTAEACSHYEQAIQLRPDDPTLHYDFALLLAADHRMPEAIAQFKASLRLDPDNIDTQQHLGIALAMAGQFPEAVATFEQFVKSHPDNAEGQFNLALAYARLNRRTEALATAQKAFELSRTQQQADLEQQIQEWIDTYRNAAADPQH